MLESSKNSIFSARDALKYPILQTPKSVGRSLLDHPSPSILAEENRGKLFVLLAERLDNPNMLLLTDSDSFSSLSELKENVHSEISELIDVPSGKERGKKAFLKKIEKMTNKAFFDRSGQNLLNESTIEKRQEKILEDFVFAIESTFSNLNEMNRFIQLPLALRGSIIDQKLGASNFFTLPGLESRFRAMKNSLQEERLSIKDKIGYLNMFLSDLYNLFENLYEDQNYSEIDNTTFFLQEVLANMGLRRKKIQELPDEVDDLADQISKIEGVKMKETDHKDGKKTQEKEYSFSIKGVRGSTSILRTRGKDLFGGALKIRNKPEKDADDILADGVGFRFIGGNIAVNEKKAEFFLEYLSKQKGIEITSLESQYIYTRDNYESVRSKYGLPSEYKNDEFDDDEKNFSNIIIRFRKEDKKGTGQKVDCEMQFIPQDVYGDNEKGVMNHKTFKRFALQKGLSLRSHSHGIPKDVVLRLLINSMYLSEKDEGEKSVSFGGSDGNVKLKKRRFREGFVNKFFKNLRVSAEDDSLFFPQKPINISRGYQKSIPLSDSQKKEIVDSLWPGIMKGDRWGDVPEKTKQTKKEKKKISRKQRSY